jgi:hypothetical protein
MALVVLCLCVSETLAKGKKESAPEPVGDAGAEHSGSGDRFSAISSTRASEHSQHLRSDFHCYRPQASAPPDTATLG